VSIYLPKGLYEKLPLLYLVAAAFLMIMPLSSWRWMAVIALALAGVTYRRRVAYRSSRQASMVSSS